MCLMPLMVLMLCSIGLVTCSTTLVGPAPGYDTVTATMGKLMSGNKLTGIVLNESNPKVTANSISMVIKTGCRMDVSEMGMPLSCSRLLPVAMQFDSFILRDDFHMMHTHKIYRLLTGTCFKHAHEATIT